MDGEIKIHRYGIHSYLNDSTCYLLKGIIRGLKDNITRSWPSVYFVFSDGLPIVWFYNWWFFQWRIMEL